MRKLLLLLFIGCISIGRATNIYTFSINEEINSRTWIYTQKALIEADENDADLIILHLNTYGGEVSFADSIRTSIMRDKHPVVVYIDKNAASAGALISIACDRIYMAPGASIGAATVVNSIDGAAAPDKYQSYMRAKMRATAESHGKDSLGRWNRDPIIAEAMVDPSVFIENIIDTGRILTFTTEEAIEHGYCESKAESIEQIIELEGYKVPDCSISEYEPTFYDSFKGTMLGTALRSILIMLIIGGIFFEFQSPGIGFPLVTAVIAALLYFAPLYLDGLATYWEILIFCIGIVLVILELFMFPGFGICGISGIICIILGLGFSLLDNNNFDFSPIQMPDLNQALMTIFIGLILSVVLIIYLGHKIGSKGIFSRLALQLQQKGEEGYVGVPTEQASLLNMQGTTHTDLRPAGKVLINDKLYDAVSLHGIFIPQNAKIIVKKYSATQIYVDNVE